MPVLPSIFRRVNFVVFESLTASTSLILKSAILFSRRLVPTASNRLQSVLAGAGFDDPAATPLENPLTPDLFSLAAEFRLI
jgi:hypothetical protein